MNDNRTIGKLQQAGKIYFQIWYQRLKEKERPQLCVRMHKFKFDDKIKNKQMKNFKRRVKNDDSIKDERQKK